MLITSLLDVQINVTVVITQTLKTAFRATRQAGLTRSQPVRPYSKRLVTSENHCLINACTYNYVLLVIYNLLVIYFYCPLFLWKITLYVLTAHAHTHQSLIHESRKWLEAYRMEGTCLKKHWNRHTPYYLAHTHTQSAPSCGYASRHNNDLAK